MPVLKSPRRELFAQLIAQGKSAVSAYVEVGYRPHEGAPSRLLGFVRNRVDELLLKGAKRAEVTVQGLIEELQEARELASRIENPAAMVGATMGKAKIAGLLIDKQELTGKDGGAVQVQALSPYDEIEQRLQRLSMRSGDIEATAIKSGDTTPSVSRN